MTEAPVQRRNEVLAAAERLFADRGFQATSVRDIAEALELQPGSLYAHISSKDELLWETVISASERFFRAAEPIVRSSLMPIEKLRQLITAHVKVVTGNLAAAAVYSTEWRHLSDERRREFAEVRNRYEDIVRSLVGECIREGTFGAVDEKFAALLILSSINWIYHWYRPDGPMSAEEIARTLTEMLFNGLRRGQT